MNTDISTLLPQKARELLIYASTMFPDIGPGFSPSRTREIDSVTHYLRVTYPKFFREAE